MPTAGRHIEQVVEFIARDDLDATRRVIQRIRASIDRLGAFPRSDRRGERVGTLELVVPGLPYIVVYRIAEDVVQILGAFHAAQDRRR